MTQTEIDESKANSEYIIETSKEQIEVLKHQLSDNKDLTKFLEKELATRVPAMELAEERLLYRMQVTADCAVDYNPTYQPPTFDAFGLGLEKPDNVIYNAIAAKIETQFEFQRIYDEAVIDVNEATDKLAHIVEDNERIEENIKKNELSIEAAKSSLGTIKEAQSQLDSDNADAEREAKEKEKAEAEAAELELVRSLATFGENFTKEVFYYNYDIESEARYSPEKFYEVEADFFDVFNSDFIVNVSTIEEAGQYLITFDEQRIDLISYNIYGSVQYWWLLLEYNEIVDQYDLVSGKEIKFFSLQDLDTKYRLAQKEQHKRGKNG